MAKISKFLKLIVLIAAVSLLPVEKVYAQVEENIVSAEAVEEVPADKLVPIPTPSPDPLLSPLAKKEDFVSDDKRSWTRFKYRSIIQKVASQYNVDPQVIYATIMTESEGNEYAYRFEPQIMDASLCMGQILISTARSLGFEGDPQQMYQPDVCIDLIGKYHRRMLDEYGELTPWQLAAAYNTGSPWRRPVAGHLFRFGMWYSET